MAQIHGVNLATFSVKQLDDIIQEAEKQKGATQAATTIAVMAAWKAAHKWLLENSARRSWGVVQGHSAASRPARIQHHEEVRYVGNSARQGY